MVNDNADDGDVHHEIVHLRIVPADKASAAQVARNSVTSSQADVSRRGAWVFRLVKAVRA